MVNTYIYNVEGLVIHDSDFTFTADDEAQLIPTAMTYDCIAQCWFRFLHIIQNPVDLCRPEIIGKTHKFMQAAMNSDTLIDPTQHECLQKLPVIFYKAMKGVSVMVNAFLGQSI